MNNSFLNENLSLISEKLNEIKKIQKEMVDKFGSDFTFNYPDREIAVVNFLKKIGISLLWNGGEINKCDAFGFLNREQINDQVEFKSHVEDLSNKKRINSKFEFDKQENEEKRIRTQNIGGLVLSVFDKNRETIYPSYVFVLSINDRNKNTWKNFIKNKQDIFLNKIKKTFGNTTPKRQSIYIDLREVLEEFSEDIKIFDKNLNQIETEFFKNSIISKRNKLLG